MPRIAVLGNCQILGVAHAISCFLPGTSVKQVLIWEAEKWYGSIDAVIKDLATYDIVLCQPLDENIFANGGYQALRASHSAVFEFPIIVFPAFHPDLVYIKLDMDGAGPFVHSPIGPYNSALAFYGYMEDLSMTETLRLYSGTVYKALGYDTLWESSVEGVLNAGKACGLDLRANLARWARSGCFMHSINHPKITVLADLAALLLAKAGVDLVEKNWAPYLKDVALDNAIWPVYPEISSALGIEGSLTFKSPDSGSPDKTPFMDLPEFVARSRDSFKFFRKTTMSSERVEAWRADGATRDLLRAVARNGSA